MQAGNFSQQQCDLGLHHYNPGLFKIALQQREALEWDSIILTLPVCTNSHFFLFFWAVKYNILNSKRNTKICYS